MASSAGPGIGAWGCAAAVARGLARVPCRVPGSWGWFAKTRTRGVAWMLPRAGPGIGAWGCDAPALLGAGARSGAWGCAAAVVRGLARVPCLVPGSRGWFAKTRARWWRGCCRALVRRVGALAQPRLEHCEGGQPRVGAEAVSRQDFAGGVRSDAVGRDRHAGRLRSKLPGLVSHIC
jgi:hypothetical protein